MTVIQSITGFEQFPIGSCKFHLFFSPSIHFPGKEVHIGVALRDRGNGSVSSLGFPNQYPAAPGYKESLGKWVQQRFEVADGAVLKIFGMRSHGGSVRGMANQYIRVRSNGPLYRVSMDTVGWDKAQFQTVNITGRFDLLSLKEATDLKVQTPPNYEKYFLPGYVNQLFRIETIERELEARSVVTSEKVVNTAGETVEVQIARKRRALDL